MALTLLALLGAGWRPAQAEGGSGADESKITENLYDVSFVDGDLGWAVGAFGVVYRTRDGGRTWRQQPTGTVRYLLSVDFVDSRRGWVVGQSGLVLHTEDGGASWQQQPSGVDKHLFAVDFVDASRGWAAGDWGTLIYTEDGGSTWQDHSRPEDVILNGVSFPDRGHGWVVGEFGTIIATADGGRTWTKQNSGTEKTLFGVDFVDDRWGWAVGIDGLVLRTRSGGAQWEVQEGQASASSFDQLGFLELLRHPGLYDVELSGKRGYIVGDIGTVLRTDDGGATWNKLKLPAGWKLHWLRGISLAPGGAGFIVGAGGLTVPIVKGELRLSH